jgi:alpha-L-fucosidase
VRWTRTGDMAHAIVDAEGTVTLDARPSALDLGSAHLADGPPMPACVVGDHLEVDLPSPGRTHPAVVDIALKPGAL